MLDYQDNDLRDAESGRNEHYSDVAAEHKMGKCLV